MNKIVVMVLTTLMGAGAVAQTVTTFDESAQAQEAKRLTAAQEESMPDEGEGDDLPENDGYEPSEGPEGDVGF